MRRVAAIALAAAFLAAATAGAATARAPQVTALTPVARGSDYLALGDSVTFGYQEPKVVPAPDYRRASNFVGFPEQLGSALHLRVTNVSCPGETSGSLINTSVPSLACENAYRRRFPLHTRYTGSQLTYAVSFLRKHPGVRLVSLMIGANDAFRCIARTKDACASPSERQTLLTNLSRDVKQILSAVRGPGHYKGQLAIVNYYSLNYASAAVNGQSRELNQAVDSAARPFGVVFADSYGIFKQASVRFGASPCLAGLLTQLDGLVGNCGVHPTFAGQALLAQALLKAIRVSGPQPSLRLPAPPHRGGLG